MIILVTFMEKEEDATGYPTGKTRLIVSHGIDENMKTVILPQEHPTTLGARWSRTFNEWVLDE